MNYIILYNYEIKIYESENNSPGQMHVSFFWGLPRAIKMLSYCWGNSGSKKKRSKISKRSGEGKAWKFRIYKSIYKIIMLIVYPSYSNCCFQLPAAFIQVGGRGRNKKWLIALYQLWASQHASTKNFLIIALSAMVGRCLKVIVRFVKVSKTRPQIMRKRQSTANNTASPKCLRLAMSILVTIEIITKFVIYQRAVLMHRRSHFGRSRDVVWKVGNEKSYW